MVKHALDIGLLVPEHKVGRHWRVGAELMDQIQAAYAVRVEQASVRRRERVADLGRKTKGKSNKQRQEVQTW